MHRLIMLKYIPDKTMGIDMKLTGRRLKSLCDRREITVMRGREAQRASRGKEH